MCQTVEVSVTYTRPTEALRAMSICARVAASVHLSGGVLLPQKENNLFVYKEIFLLALDASTNSRVLLVYSHQSPKTISEVNGLFGLGKWPMKTFSPGSTYANISNRHVRSP